MDAQKIDKAILRIKNSIEFEMLDMDASEIENFSYRIEGICEYWISKAKSINRG